MAGFKDAKGAMNNKAPRLEDLIDLLKFPSGKWTQGRLIGPIWSYVFVWFDITTKDGRKVSIPKLCLDYDSNTEEMQTEVCPYRKSGLGRLSKFYVTNMIIRDIQEAEPKKKGTPTKSESKKTNMCGYEAHVKAGKDTPLWTPVRAVQIPASLADQLRNLSKLNKATNKKTGKTKIYDLADPKYGVDLNFYYDKEAKGTAAYKVQKEHRTPLTDEELEYALWKLDLLQAEDLKKATQEMALLSKKIVSDDDEDDDDYNRSSKKRKNSDDDDDNEDSIDDIDDDEDEKPRKKKKRDDDLDDDDDEDEKPRKKKKRDDDDDDEDEKPRKKKKRDDDDDDEDEKPRKKKKVRDDDDDDDDLDDED